MDEAKQYRVAFVGTGFIAAYHARAVGRLPHAQLVAVCDSNRPRAVGFASRHDVPDTFNEVEPMLAQVCPDVVHVLTPPDQHFGIGQRALEAGAHLLLEKPMCSDPAGCEALLTKAERRNLRVGVNHNFLFHPAYEQLRDCVRGGVLGSLDRVSIEWALELPQIRSGPFDMWALRQPANILLEIGSHAVSYVLDLLPGPDDCVLRAADPVELPTGAAFYRRWHLCIWCGQTPVDLHFSFAPGHARRTIQVCGDFGAVTADLERNTCLVQRSGRRAQDLGKYETLMADADALRRQAKRNLREYVLDKAKLRRNGNAFAVSIERSLQAFYAGLAGMMDPRCSGQLGRQVVEQCTRLAKLAPAEAQAIVHTPKAICEPQQHVETLVLGGTGFIGRELVRQLIKSGRSVRIMTRSRGSAPFPADMPNLQVVTGDIRNESDLADALCGVSTVFHLARAAGPTWKDYYDQDVLGTRKLAEECIKQGIKRLVYAGSIVTYSLAGKRAITEATSFDRCVLRQNKYARAKAQAEQLLLQMHKSVGLPVVIVRPGMVIGRGGDLCHAGVGTWNGPGTCVFWGSGDNYLPLVLVEDVARGLIAAMDAADIEGESFNLVDEPCLTAREYVQEIAHFSGLNLQTFNCSVPKAFCVDIAKWMAKILLRMRDRCVPSYRVWQSRTCKAVFDCSKARRVLNWQPASDRDTILARGIHIHLMESGGASQSTLSSGSVTV